MTNLAFPPIPANFTDDEQLGKQITLLAGQINAANHRLLNIARHGTASHVEALVRRYRKVKQQDADTTEQQQDKDRELV